MVSTLRKLVFDIETIGENFDALDKVTQDALTRWLEREAYDKEEYTRLLQDIKDGLGFSPLTGEVVAVGVLEIGSEKGGVYYQTPGMKAERVEEEGMVFEAMREEADILKKFWEIAKSYQVFVTFNGRSFDVPFLMVRSAIRGIRPTKNMMAGRYLYQQHADAIHIDLLDQLSFQGAVRRKGSLHLWARAFGIKSPKEDGVSGDDVGRLFKEKKFREIAEYNVADIVATKELYERWNLFIRF